MKSTAVDEDANDLKPRLVMINGIGLGSRLKVLNDLA